MRKRKKKVQFLVSRLSSNSLERILIISIYVMSRFPQDLPGAFQYVKESKTKSNGRDFLVGNVENNYIKFKLRAYESIFPLLGILIGPVGQRQGDGPVILNDEELACVAGAERSEFAVCSKEFLRGIATVDRRGLTSEQMEDDKSVKRQNNLSFNLGKRGKVAFVAVITLGFLYWLYKSFPFTRLFFNLMPSD